MQNRIKVNRIILDTNLWVSFLITNNLSSLDEIIFSRQSIIILSEELLDEFLEVASRPKFLKYFSENDIESLLQYIQPYIDIIKVEAVINICRDPKDNFLLALAIDGQADYLLTGDKDLLEIAQIGETSIITITNFLSQQLD